MASRSPARRIALLLGTLVLASCDTAVEPPSLSTVSVAVTLSSIQVGQTVNVTAAGKDQNNTDFTLGTITWTTSAPAVATVSGAGVITGVGAGSATITATVEGKTGTAAVTVTAPAGIKINEVESNGGTPGDWVELHNPTAAAVDISGWVFKDNDDTHSYAIPAGTSIAAGAYFTLEEAAFGFGLGAPDAARLFSAFGVTVDSYSWTAHATVSYGRCANATGSFTDNAASTKGVANNCSTPVPAGVKVNEVESSGGTPGDWIELYNSGATAVNLGGFIVKDNDDTHNYTIPANTMIAAGGYLVVEEAQMGYGLGTPDAARLFTPELTIVDSYSWTPHAATSYGRCPNGTGDFATTTTVTKGAVNDCPGAWPGSNSVITVDTAGTFSSNLSGLTYEGSGSATPGVLWAVQNGPGTIFRMIKSGANWIPDNTNSWGAGKALRYVGGTGNPDTEGVTFGATVADGMYVATERNNDASTVSLNKILRIDVSGAGATLTATHEWNITADLPVVGANLGIEAITWVPDTYLTAKSFFDSAAAHTYNPADYPNHGTGLFFVGVEGNGTIYAYALNHGNSTFTRVATISSGYTAIMELAFDREREYLWAVCDDGCGGKHSTLEVDTRASLPTTGRFIVTRVFDRPTTMANLNNEGFTFAPIAECASGNRPAFWADDGATGGFSIRSTGLQCAAFP